MVMVDIIYEMRCKLDRINAAPQSVAREEARIFLEWELKRLELERRLKVIARAEFLLKAYMKNGSMSVIHPSGQILTDRAEYGGNALQHLWNAQSKAEQMAEWSIP